MNHRLIHWNRVKTVRENWNHILDMFQWNKTAQYQEEQPQSRILADHIISQLQRYHEELKEIIQDSASHPSKRKPFPQNEIPNILITFLKASPEDRQRKADTPHRTTAKRLQEILQQHIQQEAQRRFDKELQSSWFPWYYQYKSHDNWTKILSELGEPEARDLNKVINALYSSRRMFLSGQENYDRFGKIHGTLLTAVLHNQIKNPQLVQEFHQAMQEDINAAKQLKPVEVQKGYYPTEDDVVRVWLKYWSKYYPELTQYINDHKARQAIARYVILPSDDPNYIRAKATGAGTSLLGSNWGVLAAVLGSLALLMALWSRSKRR